MLPANVSDRRFSETAGPLHILFATLHLAFTRYREILKIVNTTENFDLEKYSNDGWGLSTKAFNAMLQALDSLPEIRAIEFGSGISTQFLLDYAEKKNKNLEIDSFDNDVLYKHSKAILTKLVSCNAKSYQAMFNEGEIDWSLFRKRWRKPKSRQKNCFYDLSNYALKTNYNFAVIDGPHGNGRNFAYLLLKNRMENGYILIDDFNHYDFVETASSIFTLEEIVRVEEKKDNFVLLKVIAGKS
jgi:hypothetical protein